MDKKELKKIKNRIAFLKLEWKQNNQKIVLLSSENDKILGAITELNLVLVNLAPKKKEKPDGKA